MIVVDASPNIAPSRWCPDFPGVRFLRNPRGAGTLATSRAIALEVAGGEVMAFLDDDAYARPDWLEHLLRPYRDQRWQRWAVVPSTGRTARSRQALERSGDFARTAA